MSEFTDFVKSVGGEPASPPPPAGIATSEAPSPADQSFQSFAEKAAKEPVSAAPAEPKPAPQATLPPAAEPEQEQVKSWSEVPSVAARHLVPSAIATGEAMVQPFIHPIQTYENLRDLGHGILQKAGVMSGDENTAKVDAVMGYFAKRYGGMQELRNTMANDPMGFAVDASTVLTGGAGLAAKLPGVGKAAEVAGQVGRAIEPTAIPRAAGRALIAPGTEDAAALAKAGVKSMTPGQITGGLGKAAEDMITSIPVLGSFIKSARGRSIESFNKAVANQVLEPIGETVGRKTVAGHDLVSEVGDKLSSAYDAITPKLKFVPDSQYNADIAAIKNNDVPMLAMDQQKQFASLLNKKLPQYGTLPPTKTIESTLSGFATKYMHSSVASERDLGQVVNKVLIAFRENLARNNPAEAAELKKINTAYAMYTRMRNAAARGQEGVFTPNHLVSAVKAGDRTVGKDAFARGDALMQTFAELGQRVLPSKVPSSGTTERAAMMAAILGEGVLYSPHIAGGVLAGTLPYTRAGQAVTNAAFRAGLAAKKPFGYIPRGTSYQLGKMDETEEDAYNRARRLFPQ